MFPCIGPYICRNFWSFFVWLSLGGKNSFCRSIILCQFQEFFASLSLESKNFVYRDIFCVNFWTFLQLSLKKFHSFTPMFNLRRAMPKPTSGDLYTLISYKIPVLDIQSTLYIQSTDKPKNAIGCLIRKHP